MHADANTVSAFNVHTGRKGDSVEKELGSKVVKSLFEKLHNTHHHIYVDKFVSSVDLVIFIVFKSHKTEGVTKLLENNLL